MKIKSKKAQLEELLKLISVLIILGVGMVIAFAMTNTSLGILSGLTPPAKVVAVQDLSLYSVSAISSADFDGDGKDEIVVALGKNTAILRDVMKDTGSIISLCCVQTYSDDIKDISSIKDLIIGEGNQPDVVVLLENNDIYVSYDYDISSGSGPTKTCGPIAAAGSADVNDMTTGVIGKFGYSTPQTNIIITNGYTSSGTTTYWIHSRGEVPVCGGYVQGKPSWTVEYDSGKVTKISVGKFEKNEDGSVAFIVDGDPTVHVVKDIETGTPQIYDIHTFKSELKDITTGDFDGDGLDEVAVLDENNGVWIISDPSVSNSDTFAVFAFTDNREIKSIISGDFDGDGRDEIAMLTTENKVYILKIKNE